MADRTGGHAHFDAYTPAEIARLVENVGVRKAQLPTVDTIILGLLAGVFIAFGAMFFTLTVTGSGLGFGLTRVLGGVADFIGNLVPVALGNIVGGSVFVALVYWIVYLRRAESENGGSPRG